MAQFNRREIAATLNSLPSVFDTHMIQQGYLRKYPIEFGEDVFPFRSDSDVLHRFSMVFAKWVDRTFAGQIAKTDKIVSKNLGGDENKNQEWKKITNQPIV